MTRAAVLDWGVDGVMAAEPTSLEWVLCLRNVVRPVIPRVRHCPAAVTACSAEPVRLSRAGPRGIVRLRIWREGTLGTCRGVAALRRMTSGAVMPRARRLASGRFSIVSERRATTVRLRLSRRGRRALTRRGRLSVLAAVVPRGGTPATHRFLLRLRQRVNG